MLKLLKPSKDEKLALRNKKQRNKANQFKILSNNKENLNIRFLENDKYLFSYNIDTEEIICMFKSFKSPVFIVRPIPMTFGVSRPSSDVLSTN